MLVVLKDDKTKAKQLIKKNTHKTDNMFLNTFYNFFLYF